MDVLRYPTHESGCVRADGVIARLQLEELILPSFIADNGAFHSPCFIARRNTCVGNYGATRISHRPTKVCSGHALRQSLNSQNSKKYKKARNSHQSNHCATSSS